MASVKRKPEVREAETPPAPNPRQPPAEDARLKAELAKLRMTVRVSRGKTVQTREAVRERQEQQNGIEVSPQIEHNELQEITSLPRVDKPPLLERINSLLAEEGFAEQQRPALSQAVTQLIEIAANDPPLFAAKIAAAEKVQAVTPPAGRPPKLTHAQREDIRQRRVAGEQVNQLAESFGVDRATIFRITHEGSQKKAGTRL